MATTRAKPDTEPVVGSPAEVWQVPPLSPPTSIEMGPHRYTIRSDEDTADLLRSEGNNGDSRAHQLLIRLDPRVAAVHEVLLHEILHCAWDLTPLRCMDGVKDHEEEVVTALAPLILDALRRNAQLVAYLTGEVSRGHPDEGA